MYVSGLTLQPNINYVFHIRAWYDDERFAIFTSDGIKTDSLPPELSSSRKVKEMSSVSAPADTDFLSSTDDLTLSWLHVFRDAHADIKEFHISIGRCPDMNSLMNTF